MSVLKYTSCTTWSHTLRPLLWSLSFFTCPIFTLLHSFRVAPGNCESGYNLGKYASLQSSSPILILDISSKSQILWGILEKMAFSFNKIHLVLKDSYDLIKAHCLLKIHVWIYFPLCLSINLNITQCWLPSGLLPLCHLNL